MRVKDIKILVLLILITTTVTGCFTEEYATSPNEILSFSTDTVKFDTIYSEQGSSTKRFMIYNQNSKAVIISSISLTGGNESGFYINIDGTKGPYINSLVVSAKDSLFAFVEATPSQTEQVTPQEILGEISFITNSVTQRVVLQAYAQDATTITDKEIEEGELVLTQGNPYLIYDSLVIRPNATLKIEAGAQLRLHDKAKIIIEGTIISEGTMTQPVVIQGDRTDNLLTNLPYSRLAGQWDGIYIRTDSKNNSLNYTTVQGTSNGIHLEGDDLENVKLTITNSIIHNSTGDIIEVNGCNVEISNSQLSNAVGSLLDVKGGIAKVTQCTLANYYSLFENIDEALVRIDQEDYEEIEEGEEFEILTPSTVEIINSIVIGNTSVISPTDLTGLTVTFYSTLFGVDGSDDTNFINCVWGGDPKFIKSSADDDYIYNFRIDTTESDAYQAGDQSFLTSQLLQDMYGVARPWGVNPDLGAYQIVESED